MKNIFKKSIVALVTPFDKKGQIDFIGLEKLINWHIKSGTNSIVIGGTTGESSTLSTSEHVAVVKYTIGVSNGQIPIIAGVGSNNTSESRALIEECEEAGCDGLMIVSPYYNKPSQEGLYQHFKTLHDISSKPIILYNIPQRSSIDISITTISRLSDLPRVVGLKDATGDLSRVIDQQQKCGDDFIQVSGDDFTSLAFNAHGGTGCISVVANVFPSLCAKFQDAFINRDIDLALRYQQKISFISSILFSEPSPGPVKYALSYLNFCKNELRLPMLAISERTEENILKLINTEWRNYEQNKI